MEAGKKPVVSIFVGVFRIPAAAFLGLIALPFCKNWADVENTYEFAVMHIVYGCAEFFSLTPIIDLYAKSMDKAMSKLTA